MFRLMRERVFISYAWKDGAKVAEKLCTDLDARAYNVWLDRERLIGGSNWSREIEENLDNSEIVLVLLSGGSYESVVCRVNNGGRWSAANASFQ
jgi:TIR domain